MEKQIKIGTTGTVDSNLGGSFDVICVAVDDMGASFWKRTTKGWVSTKSYDYVYGSDVNEKVKINPKQLQ